MNDTIAVVSDASISPEDTAIIPEDTTFTFLDTNVTNQGGDPLFYNLCSGQHILNLSATSGGTTNPPPCIYVYDHATRITLRADPDRDYYFSEWSGDVSSTDNQISLTMDLDKSIQANFYWSTVVWEEAKKTPCFIATTAYESPSHPHVRILQDFRDKYLMTNKFGREVVDLYYRYSPYVANLIKKNMILKVMARISLLPLVAICFSTLHFGPIITGVMLLFIFAFPFLFVLISRRKKS